MIDWSVDSPIWSLNNLSGGLREFSETFEVLKIHRKKVLDIHKIFTKFTRESGPKSFSPIDSRILRERACSNRSKLSTADAKYGDDVNIVRIVDIVDLDDLLKKIWTILLLEKFALLRSAPWVLFGFSVVEAPSLNSREKDFCGFEISKNSIKLFTSIKLSHRTTSKLAKKHLLWIGQSQTEAAMDLADEEEGFLYEEDKMWVWKIQYFNFLKFPNCMDFSYGKARNSEHFSDTSCSGIEAATNLRVNIFKLTEWLKF